MKAREFIFFIIVFITSSLTARAQYTKLLDFQGALNGSYPWSALIPVGSFLYGVTPQGSTNDAGTIFRIYPDGTGYEKLHDFIGTQPEKGFNPHCALVYDGTFLYGTTSMGGEYAGIIFKIKPDGTGFAKLHDFQGANDGSFPWGSLFLDGTVLYGTTSGAGTHESGTIYKIKTDGSGYVKLFDFSDTLSGSLPVCNLISDGTYLYGMTINGGKYGMGVIYKIKTDGTGFKKLLDFSGMATGASPAGSLIFDGTFLYGTSLGGGANNKGTIFKLKPDGTEFSRLFDFSGDDGKGCEYIMRDGATIYGTTYNGGTANMGTLFKIKTDGTGFTKLIDFTGLENGSNSHGPLILDGSFLYGMTEMGGTYNLGTIFKYEIVTTGLTAHKAERGFTIFPNPASDRITLNTDHSQASGLIVNIYTITGKLIRTEKSGINQKQINISDLKNGVYLVELISDKKIEKQKLIIQR